MIKRLSTERRVRQGKIHHKGFRIHKFVTRNSSGIKSEAVNISITRTFYEKN